MVFVAVAVVVAAAAVAALPTTSVRLHLSDIGTEMGLRQAGRGS